MISKFGNWNENAELRGCDGSASHMPFLCIFFVMETKHIGFPLSLVMANKDELKSSGTSSNLDRVPW
jgi:hypothetical protein